MPVTYYTIMTNKGLSLSSPITVSKVAVGDGNGSYYTPSPTQTALVRQTWSTTSGITTIPDSNDPERMVTEAVIPTGVSAMDIREIGLFSNTNELIAIAKVPLISIPAPDSGVQKAVPIRFIFTPSNTSMITVVHDPTLTVPLAYRNVLKNKVQVMQYLAKKSQTEIPGTFAAPPLAYPVNARADVLSHIPDSRVLGWYPTAEVVPKPGSCDKYLLNISMMEHRPQVINANRWATVNITEYNPNGWFLYRDEGIFSSLGFISSMETTFLLTPTVFLYKPVPDVITLDLKLYVSRKGSITDSTEWVLELVKTLPMQITRINCDTALVVLSHSFYSTVNGFVPSQVLNESQDTRIRGIAVSIAPDAAGSNYVEWRAVILKTEYKYKTAAGQDTKRAVYSHLGYPGVGYCDAVIIDNSIEV